MALPADEVGERAGQRLIGDEIARQDDAGARDQHDQRHAGEPGPGVGQEALRRHRRDEGDDAPHEPRHRCVEDGDEEFDHEQGYKQPLGLPREVPIEREQRLRRHRIGRRLGRIQRLFEQVKHRVSRPLMPQRKARGKAEDITNWSMGRPLLAAARGRSEAQSARQRRLSV